MPPLFSARGLSSSRRWASYLQRLSLLYSRFIKSTSFNCPESWVYCFNNRQPKNNQITTILRPFTWKSTRSTKILSWTIYRLHPIKSQIRTVSSLSIFLAVPSLSRSISKAITQQKTCCLITQRSISNCKKTLFLQ